MAEANDATDLIGHIYDAALDPSLWPDVLGAACRFLDCASGTINSFDLARSSLSINVSYGHDPAYTQLLLDHYIHINPLRELSLKTDIGEVFSLGQITDYDTITATRFWKEWVAPQGYVDAMEAKLDKTPTASAALTLIRHADVGRIDQRALRQLRRLTPHFRRAVLIGKAIDLRHIEAETFTTVVDGLMAAIFLLDGEGRIAYANPSAEAMLRDREIVRMDSARLALLDPLAEQELRTALRAASAGDDAALTDGGLAVALKSAQGRRHLAHVLPLGTGARRAAGNLHAATAAVFIRRTDLETASAFKTLRKAFSLTPNEVRVLEAVVEINGAAAIGDVLGMSEATVKTHLHHLFEKTGSRRQADLVRLVADHASPLGPAADRGSQSNG